MKRYPVNKRRSVRKFKRTQSRTRTANIANPKRGGYRL